MEARSSWRWEVIVGPTAAVLLVVLTPIAMVVGSWQVWAVLGLAAGAAVFGGALGMRWTVTHEDVRPPESIDSNAQ